MWTRNDANPGGYEPVAAALPPEDLEPPRIHNRPARDQWDRIVVDQAAFAVTARAAPGADVPDTICDGWSTPDFAVRLVSSRGDAHRHSGRPRQDHALITEHRESGSVLFAVMDGLSDARWAHVGAEKAGVGAMDALWAMADRGEVDLPSVAVKAAAALVEHPHHGLAPGEALADVERRLATTIVAGVVRVGADGPTVEMFRVGDSSAWLLEGDRFTPLFGVKGHGEATISSTVDPLPRLPAVIKPVRLPLPPHGVLLVGTDGIGDPLGDGTGLVGELLAEALAEPPPILGLAHVVDFSRDTFDDDRTLVAIWPRPRPRRGGR